MLDLIVSKFCESYHDIALGSCRHKMLPLIAHLTRYKFNYEGWNFNSGNYLFRIQLIQNRYMFRSSTVLHCSHQNCVQPVASDVEVVGYL